MSVLVQSMALPIVYIDDESEHSDKKFYYPGELPKQSFFKYQLTPKKKRKKVKTSHQWWSSQFY